MHGKDASIEEILDWRPYDYFTIRNTVPTPAGPIRFLQTMEFEPTPAGTILHYRFAAPKTSKERAIMEQMASWLEDAMRTSATHLTEQLSGDSSAAGGTQPTSPRCHGPNPMNRSQARRRARNPPVQLETLAPRGRCGRGARLRGVGRFAWMGRDFKGW
jgi:hypothetical protein